MEIMMALHHEILHYLSKACEETLLFVTSKAAAPKLDRKVERIHSVLSS